MDIDNLNAAWKESVLSKSRQAAWRKATSSAPRGSQGRLPGAGELELKLA